MGLEDDPWANYWERRPDPSDEEIAVVCRAWLSYQRERHEKPDDDDPDWWAVEAAMDAEMDGPLIWRIIRCLCSLAEPDDPAVAMIGVGPMESMLFDDGDGTMDLIEPAADEAR